MVSRLSETKNVYERTVTREVNTMAIHRFRLNRAVVRKTMVTAEQICYL